MSRARDIADGKFSGDLEADSPTFVVDAANNLVGIGTSSPLTKFTVSGGYISQTNAGVSTYFGEDGSGGSLAGTTTNHYFRFITNDTERMRIDSAGRVTMPYQPAFRAVVGNEAYLTTNPVPFGTTTLNVGNHFNTSTYTFTAPVSGTYFISVGLYLRTDNNEDIGPALRINGTTLQYAYLYNSGNGGRIDSTGVIAVVTSLSANDAVSVGLVTASGEYFGGSAETYFSGYLIG